VFRQILPESVRSKLYTGTFPAGRGNQEACGAFFGQLIA